MFELIEREVPEAIDKTIFHSQSEIKGGISDGYHTFDELYAHRAALYIQVSKMYANYIYTPEAFGRPSKRKKVWRSLLHSDGTNFNGWFILGIGTEPGEQITYHLPLIDWTKCDFAGTLDKAPEFDGHTSADVLERISKL